MVRTFPYTLLSCTASHLLTPQGTNRAHAGDRSEAHRPGPGTARQHGRVHFRLRRYVAEEEISELVLARFKTHATLHAYSSTCVRALVHLSCAY